jgi:hypothetical protein
MGTPLQVHRDVVHSRSGTVVGRIADKMVFDQSGRYVGTIVDDRLVYRSTDSANVGTFSAPNIAGLASADTCAEHGAGSDHVAELQMHFRRHTLGNPQ